MWIFLCSLAFVGQQYMLVVLTKPEWAAELVYQAGALAPPCGVDCGADYRVWSVDCRGNTVTEPLTSLTTLQYGWLIACWPICIDCGGLPVVLKPLSASTACYFLYSYWMRETEQMSWFCDIFVSWIRNRQSHFNHLMAVLIICKPLPRTSLSNK